MLRVMSGGGSLLRVEGGIMSTGNSRASRKPMQQDATPCNSKNFAPNAGRLLVGQRAVIGEATKRNRAVVAGTERRAGRAADRRGSRDDLSLANAILAVSQR